VWMAGGEMGRGEYPGVYYHPLLKRWVVSVTVFVGAFDDQGAAGEVAARLDRATGAIRQFVVDVGNGAIEVRNDSGV
jgi:hypothetical protein